MAEAALMAIYMSFLVALFFFPLLSFSQPSNYNNFSTINGYKCSNLSLTPCSTFVHFRANSPDYTSLSSISDLLSVSMAQIRITNNLTLPYENFPLADNQKLFIPVTCSCMNDLSQYNTSYQIRGGDTYYLVSTIAYQNLTTYQAVEIANPALVPENLTIGVVPVFPIRCGCPTEANLVRKRGFLVTYVVAQGDTLDSIAKEFGSSKEEIISANGDPNLSALETFNTILIPVSQLPVFPRLDLPAAPPRLPSQWGFTPNSTFTEEKNKALHGIIRLLSLCLGAVGFLFLFVLVLLVMFFVWWKKRKSTGRGGFAEEKLMGSTCESRMTSLARTVSPSFRSPRMEQELAANISDCLDKYTLFSINDLKEATDDFNARNVIQGNVYKAKIGDQVFAVKKMKSDVSSELKILQKVNHGNLVRLEGFSIDASEGECYLVYEFFENGSLLTWLSSRKPLDWRTRIRIALDVAKGLNYIHDHTQPSVVHKDIKSSNILLDAKLRAKIANFGLAKSGCNAITQHIVGTKGYMSPEYLMDGIVTTKMDVFAFGVVLLELLLGKSAVGDGGKLLWVEAEKQFEGSERDLEQTVKVWMDQSIIEGGNMTMGSVISVLSIARTCIRKEPSKRPALGNIVYLLSRAEESCSDCSVDSGLDFPFGISAR